MTARAAWRGVVLALTLGYCWLQFIVTTVNARLRGHSVSSQQRAEWMQTCGRLVLRAIGIRYRVEGRLPAGRTLIVANHLSYLDIAICSAAMPAAFVAKQEIGEWPAFGMLARLGGTIFVNRESCISAWDTAETISDRLAEGVSVLVFPEGTSTDGSEVMPFHSTLFEPCIAAGIAATPAAVFYEPEAGLMERELCWYGDESFLPHLMRVLEVPGFTAVVRFGDAEVFPDRRTAAWRSHDAIERMRLAGTSAQEAEVRAVREWQPSRGLGQVTHATL